MVQMLVNAKGYDWSTWTLGILRSFISGGSASMVAGFTSMGIAPNTFNLTNSIGNTIKLMAVMFLFQGAYRMFEFLAIHGAPDKLQQALQTAADAADASAKQAQVAANAVTDAKEAAVQEKDKLTGSH
jgi:hypothetical protein